MLSTRVRGSLAPLSSSELQRVLLGSILLPGLLFAVLAALLLSQCYRTLGRDAAIVHSDRVLAACTRAELACAGASSTSLAQELEPRLGELLQLTSAEPEQQAHLQTMLGLVAAGPQRPDRMLQGLQAIFAAAQSTRIEQTYAFQQGLVQLLLGCALAGVVPILVLSWWQRRYLAKVLHSYDRILRDLSSVARRNQDLAKHLQQAQELERRRIARELHDDLGQIFASYKMDLNWLLRQPELAPALSERIAEMIELNSSAVTSVRRIVNELRPAILDDLGLLEALDWLLKDFGTRTGVAVRSRLPEVLKVSAELQSTLFRIVQEGLTNVGRHAEASQVSLQMKLEPHQVWLRLADNGRGLSAGPAEAFSAGQLGVRERAEILGGWAGYRNRRGRSGAVLLAILPREEC